MLTCSFFYSIKRRFMMLFLALLLLCGCGSQSLPTQRPQNTPTSIPPTSIPPTSTPVPTPTVSGSGSTTSGPFPLGTRIDFDLGGWLHIYSDGGFTCSIPPPSPISTLVTLTPGVLVLQKTLPTDGTYDQGRLQPLENYLSSVQQAFNGIDVTDPNTGNLDARPYPAFPANSDAFQLVPVSLANYRPACSEVLHITNIGNALVKISQISAQLRADTQVDNQRYNLIDICSLPPFTPGCAPGPSGGGEPIYTANFALHPGKANDVIPAAIEGVDPESQQLTLQPNEVAKVIISYTSQDSLSFSLLPSFTLDWPGNQTTYPAPQLQETFAFGSASQFSCYSLKGQHFIEIPPSSIHSTKSDTWCI